MSKQIGLYAPDASAYPNYALMRLSSYLKKYDHRVHLNPDAPPSEFEISFSSIIFPWTDTPDTTFVGGPKYLDSVLPPEIDQHFPDYALYPGQTTSIGISYRGCIRKCWFCHNHKFPKSTEHTPISRFHNPNFDTIALLDSNFLASPWWEDTCDEILNSKLRLILLNGVDARLVTETAASKLIKLNLASNASETDGYLAIAWDIPADRELIVAGIRNLKQAGFKRLKCYVLLSSRTTEAEDIQRILTLHNEGVQPLPIVYDPQDVTKMRVYEFILERFPNCQISGTSFDCQNRQEFVMQYVPEEKRLTSEKLLGLLR